MAVEKFKLSVLFKFAEIMIVDAKYYFKLYLKKSIIIAQYKFLPKQIS